MYFHCLFMSVFFLLTSSSSLTLHAMQCTPGVLCSPFPPVEGRWLQDLTALSLPLQDMREERVMALLSFHSKRKSPDHWPTSVMLRTWSVVSTLISILELQCFSLLFPAAFASFLICCTARQVLSAGKIFMAFYF